jgi:hypothetical protein
MKKAFLGIAMALAAVSSAPGNPLICIINARIFTGEKMVDDATIVLKG